MPTTILEPAVVIRTGGSEAVCEPAASGRCHRPLAQGCRRGDARLALKQANAVIAAVATPPGRPRQKIDGPPPPAAARHRFDRVVHVVGSVLRQVVEVDRGVRTAASVQARQQRRARRPSTPRKKAGSHRLYTISRKTILRPVFTICAGMRIIALRKVRNSMRSSDCCSSR